MDYIDATLQGLRFCNKCNEYVKVNYTPINNDDDIEVGQYVYCECCDNLLEKEYYLD